MVTPGVLFFSDVLCGVLGQDFWPMSVQCRGGEICLQRLNALYGFVLSLSNTGINKWFPNMSHRQCVYKMSQIGRCVTHKNVGIAAC